MKTDKNVGDKISGSFGTLTVVELLFGKIMYLVNYYDGSRQYFNDETDAYCAITDFSSHNRVA